jgi:hypothetical protein
VEHIFLYQKQHLGNAEIVTTLRVNGSRMLFRFAMWTAVFSDIGVCCFCGSLELACDQVFDVITFAQTNQRFKTVVSNIFSIYWEMSSSQLTFIFFRGVETTNQKIPAFPDSV